MLLAQGSSLYLVEGTISGRSSQLGFWIVPTSGYSDLRSNDAFSVGNTVSDIFNEDTVTSDFIAAIKGLFDGATYGSGSEQITVTDPVVTHYSQSSATV